MGYLPNWAIYFTTYDLFKTFVAEDLHIGMYNLSSPFLDYNCNPGSIDDPRTHILAAMSAGILSTVSTNPLWVIKTRLMVRWPAPSFSSHSQKRRSQRIHRCHTKGSPMRL